MGVSTLQRLALTAAQGTVLLVHSLAAQLGNLRAGAGLVRALGAKEGQGEGLPGEVLEPGRHWTL